jgi:DNA-binding response OmpR family regulator
LRARGQRAPVILITARDEPGLREEAARRGVTAYLAKPFLGTALLAVDRAAMTPAGRGWPQLSGDKGLSAGSGVGQPSEMGKGR